MDFILKRFYDNHYSTTGIMYLEGVPFCTTLEPPFRHKKVIGKTRIPAGKYKVELIYDSPMAIEYATKYGINGLPSILDVPDFENVRMHVGNYARDTNACILVGDTLQVNVDNNIDRQCIRNSMKSFTKLVNVMSEACDDIFITIMDD